MFHALHVACVPLTNVHVEIQCRQPSPESGGPKQIVHVRHLRRVPVGVWSIGRNCILVASVLLVPVPSTKNGVFERMCDLGATVRELPVARAVSTERGLKVICACGTRAAMRRVVGLAGEAVILRRNVGRRHLCTCGARRASMHSEPLVTGMLNARGQGCAAAIRDGEAQIVGKTSVCRRWRRYAAQSRFDDGTVRLRASFVEHAHSIARNGYARQIPRAQTLLKVRSV